MIRKLFTITIAVLTGSLLMAGTALAVPCAVNYDYVLYEAGADWSVYSATITMGFDGTNLTLVVTNTSGDAGMASWNLLTGVGFDLPDGWSITGGTATATIGAYWDGAYTAGPVNVSGEWGWGAGIGQFNTVIPGIVDWDISAMEASTDNVFSSTPVSAPPPGLDGPEFGIKATGTSAGGLNYIDQTATFVLTLDTNGDTWTQGRLCDFLNQNDVAIAFGSPDSVPEPTTLLLLGIGMIGLAGLRKKLI